MAGNDGAVVAGNDGTVVAGNDGAVVAGNDGAVVAGNDGAVMADLIGHPVQRQNPFGVSLIPSRDNHLGDVGAIAVAAVADLLQILQIGSAGKIMERTDDFGAALLAHRAEALAESGIGLNLKICKAGTRADGKAK